MFYYDENGEVQHTADREEKSRKHVETMLRSSTYNLSPSAAAGLREILGEVRPEEGRREARRRVRRALEEAGLTNAPLNVAINALDDEWQAKIQVGEA